jgi:hypothetical protein
MSQDNTEYDTETALQRMQEQYRQETGEELPDHVLENYHEFFGLTQSTADMQLAFDRDREAAAGEYSQRDLVAVFTLAFVVALFLGLGVAFTVAQSGAVAVSALVAAGVGFIAGSLLTR